MAVWQCLPCFQGQVASKTVLLQTNNMMVVHYISKEGGTTLASLCYLAWEVLQWWCKNSMEMRAVHLVGTDNGVVDLLSRKKVSPLKWSLDRGVVKCLFMLLGGPHVNRFASAENAQLPTFCSFPVAVASASPSWATQPHI